MRILIAASVFALSSTTGMETNAHSGRTNSEGCHNVRATGEYHCHSGVSRRSNSVGDRGDYGSIASKNEGYYNRLLAEVLKGRAETTHSYGYDGGRATIRVDIETDRYVVEGGLDKRSSLDSIQQALFASTVTGKEPVVVIYDTDGKEGKFEYRIKVSA